MTLPASLHNLFLATAKGQTGLSNWRFLKYALGGLSLLLAGSYAQAADPAHPVVLELFTSQSCSSCPPADALLKSLAQEDNSLLVLSYHVDYWDHLSWKDTYSSAVNTERQRAYNRVLNAGIFTPQLIVNGTLSAVGSDKGAIMDAIAEAKQKQPKLTITIAPQNNQLAVTITSLMPSLSDADIWEVQFDRYASTQVAAGENGGRTLESINNVTRLKQSGHWSPQQSATTILMDTPQTEDVAIIVQEPNQGEILGAAYFKK